MHRFEHGGDVFDKNIRFDYSVNLNPLGMPPDVKDAIISNIDDFEAYPDTKCHALCKAIAAREGVSADNILCGNGAADLIYRVCLSQKPKRILTLAPTFSEYERAARLCGSSIIYHRLIESEDFSLTERILDDITPEIDMFFLCNPNNPTGKLAISELLARIAHRCIQTGTIFILDECFLPFTNGESLLSLIHEIPNMAILRVFTKIYSMAGLRLGYMMTANNSLIKAVGENAQCWSVSSVAQTAGLAALNCDRWEDMTRQLVSTERDFLSSALKKLGFTVYKSDANYVLIKSEIPLYNELLQKGILIRRCENYDGLDTRFYRFAVKQHSQNEELIHSIAEVLYG